MVTLKGSVGVRGRESDTVADQEKEKVDKEVNLDLSRRKDLIRVKKEGGQRGLTSPLWEEPHRQCLNYLELSMSFLIMHLHLLQ